MLREQSNSDRPGAASILGADERFLLLLPLAAAIWLAWWVGPAPGDDAFITYRYASNLANGQEYVYNIGERR